MNECTLDILAGKVLDARAKFDMLLLGEKTYPLRAFEELWLALNHYAVALGNSRSLNRDVAWKINGLREYLELEFVSLFQFFILHFTEKKIYQ